MRGQLLERALSGTGQSGKCDRLDHISRFAQDGQEPYHPFDLSQLRLHIEKCSSHSVGGSRIALICGSGSAILDRPVPRHSVLLATTNASYWQEVQWDV
ncbi:MAG: hypothetical protein BGN87_12970 [Rhizobiales bacterium 65-79]|nr:hypothetical protein [Hyphomicrobiales bacterium]OJU06175.1 MAG: hypothetical protein BGN87_12970 [Rhizobiales bacterium 65-79]